MEIENSYKPISAREDEEDWLEIQSYRDAEHVKEFAASMEGDKSIEPSTNDSWIQLTMDLSFPLVASAN